MKSIRKYFKMIALFDAYQLFITPALIALALCAIVEV